ncbi:MAG TPA: copper amine oxidase N-terminal domain-containing protein [Abditibacteriaceae bacterium]
MKTRNRKHREHVLWAGTAALGLGLATAQVSQAQSPPIQVSLNGQFISFGQVTPVQVGGRVLVPLRGIFESLGSTVNYEASTATIYASSGARNIQLRLGSTEATVNGQTRYLDVPAQVRFGRTLVPLRFVSEAMGANVSWNESQRTVFIAPAGGTGPVVTEPPVVAEREPYYPPGDVPTNAVITISGTVRRDLTGTDRFQMESDDGVILTVQTRADEPARLNRGDRVQVRGRMSGEVFLADRVRLTATTGTRTRVVGIVTSILSSTRLNVRTDAGQTLTVSTGTPFPTTVSVGDRVRVPGVLDGDFLRADRIVVVTDRAASRAGQRVDFRGVVEFTDVVEQTLQVRGDNGVLYVVRFFNVTNLQEGDRVRVVGTYANGTTTASSVTPL